VIAIIHTGIASLVKICKTLCANAIGRIGARELVVTMRCRLKSSIRTARTKKTEIELPCLQVFFILRGDLEGPLCDECYGKVTRTLSLYRGPGCCCDDTWFRISTEELGKYIFHAGFFRGHSGDLRTLCAHAKGGNEHLRARRHRCSGVGRDDA
jgi:hypothetical protein